MERIVFNCTLTNKDAKLPTKAYETDAGFDLYSCENVFIELGSHKLIHTGFHMNIPAGFYAQIHSRSSMAKSGLVASGGVIDSQYLGEIGVILNNLSCDADQDPVLFTKGKLIKKGDRIAQFIIHKLPEVTLQLAGSLETTPRGSNGYGSSGR